jgi:GDP-L-fucose synthase
MAKKKTKIFLAGHNGMVGSAVYRKLSKSKIYELFTIDKKKLDLRDQKKVFSYLKKIKPESVILAAAKVGGILSNNTFRAEFIYDNLAIQNNIIHGSYINGVKNLIFLGSSCVYPKNSKQPIKEEYLLSNYLEKTNEPYAIAKIAGISLCESYNRQYKLNYKCLMPCNAYGINDDYDSLKSHFLPALIKKIIIANKEKKNFIEIWGKGRSLREVIFADDIADACIFFLKKKTHHTLINIGSGIEASITDYANYIMKFLGIKLRIKYNHKMLEGTYRKILDKTIAKKYGWTSKTSFKEGLKLTINDFLKNI